MLSTVTESPQEEVRGCECVCVWLGGWGVGGVVGMFTGQMKPKKGEF